jgi:hypothetical protein
MKYLNNQIRATMLKKIIAIIVLSLAFAGIANAGVLDEAGADFNAGNYKAALAGFKPLAEQGNVEAQSALGYMYNKGLGVSEDNATVWLRIIRTVVSYRVNYLGVR